MRLPGCQNALEKVAGPAQGLLSAASPPEPRSESSCPVLALVTPAWPLARLSVVQKGVEGHPENKDVLLRLRPADGDASRVLAELFGGQGTINVPSWSPDSRRLAFVSYRLSNP